MLSATYLFILEKSENLPIIECNSVQAKSFDNFTYP